MFNGTGDRYAHQVSRLSGMVRGSSDVNGSGYMGPEKGYPRSSDPEFFAPGTKSEGRKGPNRKKPDIDRNDTISNPGIHGSSQGSEGLILGRLYRLIFGGIKGDPAKDEEIVKAYGRVSHALEGLDNEVLLLMSTVLKIKGDPLNHHN